MRAFNFGWALLSFLLATNFRLLKTFLRCHHLSQFLALKPQFIAFFQSDTRIWRFHQLSECCECFIEAIRHYRTIERLVDRFFLVAIRGSDVWITGFSWRLLFRYNNICYVYLNLRTCNLSQITAGKAALPKLFERTEDVVYLSEMQTYTQWVEFI